MEKFESGINPEEHTQHAADRAFDLLDQGDLKQAIDSMVSDMGKDANTPQEQKTMIGMMGLALRNDPALDEQKVQEFIEGFPGVKKRTSSTAPLKRVPEYKIPEYKEPEPSTEEIENAKIFINLHITNNEVLTQEAKDFITKTIKTKRGPWSVKNFVTKVEQNGKKITITSKTGEAFLYL